MSLPTPPLACKEHHQILHFLEAHYQQGGFEHHTHAMLRRIVRLMNQVSQCLFPPQSDFNQDVKKRVRLLCEELLSIFDIFGEHLAVRNLNAQKADDDLPDLAVRDRRERCRRMEEWRQRLEGTHNPDENDVNMYLCFRMYYDQYVWIPFLQRHQAEPEHESWELKTDLAFIQECLELLHESCKNANQLVEELDREFMHGLKSLGLVAEVGSPKHSSEAASSSSHRWDTRGLSEAEIRVRARFAYQQLCTLDDFFGSDGTPSPSTGTASFGSFSGSSYSIVSGVGTPLIPTRPNSENGSRGSRVFTGSFSDLEESIKNLFAECATEELKGAKVKVKDFALATPRLLPSPATLLERRDALSVREAGWNHHFVAGRLVKSRRPDTQRARTIDDVTGGLDAWLSEDSSSDQSTMKTIKASMRRLERQCTI